MNFDKPTREDKITYLISLRGNITQDFDDYLKTEYNKMDNDELDIEFDFATISTSFFNCKVASHFPLMISDITNLLN